MLPEVIRLSEAIIDRHARLIVEWDAEKKGRIWIDNGRERYYYDGEDAQIIWKTYHPENLESWKTD